MKTTTLIYDDVTGWRQAGGRSLDRPELVIWFAAPRRAADPAVFEGLKARYPGALIAGCSTGGEIIGDEVLDGTAVAAAVQFEATQVRAAQVRLDEISDIREAGRRLAADLAADDLKAVYVLSDGVRVNGATLVEGLLSGLPAEVTITGGLAGDGADFGATRVGLNAAPSEGVIAAIGFYGDRVRVGWGSAGGWAPFGPERKITKSEGAVLHELDGQPALDLYKLYLGDAAARLPGSALLFPLVIRPEPGSSYDVVRTIVGVDEAARSLIFAGDVPQGWSGQLMRGNPENLVDGAIRAARQAGVEAEDADALALVVSCIGRKLMMGQRVSDEVEAVAEVWGATPTIGFYSYGEICPHGFTGRCTLHNQTMTVTLLREAS